MATRDPTRARRSWPAAAVTGCAFAVLTALAAGALAEEPSPQRGELLHRASDSTFDDPLDFLRGFLTPTIVSLFEDLEHDLRAESEPLPARVRRALAPYFDGVTVGRTRLTPAVIERATFVVDARRAREIFDLAPDGVEAMTFGDVIAFTRDSWEPDCIEGVALAAHELVHVAQYRALGKAAFLDRYFLGETLRESLTGDGDETAFDPSRNTLEVEAYCHQERVCRALAHDGELPPCHGRATARCPTCTRRPGRGDEDERSGERAPRHADDPASRPRKPVPIR